MSTKFIDQTYYNRLSKSDQHLGVIIRTRGTEKTNKIVDYELSLAKGGFFYQSSRLLDLLPGNIKEAKTLKLFKKKCKVWVKGNISVRP